MREALSHAIDRKGIVDKIMEGVGLPAGDFLPWPAFGTSKDTQPDRYDPAAARQLLAEAGYPNGFSITLGTPNGRYINDLKVAQAIAAMWSRIGVKTEVEATAPPVFFKNRDEFKYSAYLAGWGCEFGRDVQSAARAGRDAQPREGHGRHQPRPLLESRRWTPSSRRRCAPSTTRSARRCCRRRASW